VAWILDRIANGEHGVVLEPRGHAKTTWANTILLSYLIAQHPNLRIGLISNTAKQSNAFSRAIRWTLEANEYFKNTFGNLMGDHKWTDVEWVQRGSALHGSKDVTMYSAGAGGAIISKRFDLILCDDIIDEENYANPEQAQKMDTWFWKTLKPCLAPGGSLIVIGTRWAEGDLYQQLIEDKKWPSLVRSAIFYDDDDKGRERPIALWPALWPINKLEQERRDMGTAMFSCSYLNDISGLMTGNIFQREWYKGNYFRELPKNKRYRLKMGVDLATSERQEADYTARVTIAEDEELNVYVLSVVREKRATGHRQFVVDGANVYPAIERILVENNQFQSALVQELLNTTRLPVVGKRADVDKVTRARAVAARYESGKVHHHHSLEGSDFEIELLQFPKGHDDMIDALGLAMETGSTGFYYGSLQR
jgi:predicted phage terminase large subunit-like protein